MTHSRFNKLTPWARFDANLHTSGDYMFEPNMRGQNDHLLTPRLGGKLKSARPLPTIKKLGLIKTQSLVSRFREVEFLIKRFDHLKI